MVRNITLLLAILCAVGSASAALVTTSAGFSSPTTTTFSFPTATLHVPGPFTVGGGITVSGSPSMSVGGTSYSLGSNGSWTSSFFWAGTDSNTSAMTFNLGGLFAQVGGFMNYSINSDSGPTAILSALAADGVTVLESYDLRVLAPIITTGSNAGAFRGISRATADIGFFRLQGSFLIEHDITTGVAGLPEPTTLGSVGFALVALAAALRRRIV